MYCISRYITFAHKLQTLNIKWKKSTAVLMSKEWSYIIVKSESLQQSVLNRIVIMKFSDIKDYRKVSWNKEFKVN